MLSGNEFCDFLQFADWSTVKLNLNISESSTKVKQISPIHHERIFLRFELIVCLSIIQNKIRIQTSHKSCLHPLTKEPVSLNNKYILWADASPKLCPQYFRSEGSLLLPSNRGGGCISLAGLECDEAHLLWPARSLLLSIASQVRGGTPAHPLCWYTTAKGLQGLAMLCYGLDWKMTRDRDIAWEQQLYFEIISMSRTEDAKLCAVSGGVHASGFPAGGEKPLKTPFPNKIVLIVARLNGLKSPTYVFNEKNGQAIARAPHRNRTSWAVADGLPYKVLMKVFNNSSVYVLGGVSMCICLCTHTHCAMLHKVFKIT